MNAVQRPADYTLDGIIPDSDSTGGTPKIASILALDVTSADLHCVKGDCGAGDACQPECGY
jgi:hypothetical protein